MEAVKSKGRKPINLKAFEKIRTARQKKVVIAKIEWKLKTPPGAHILRKYLKREYKVQTLINNSGWVITRI